MSARSRHLIESARDQTYAGLEAYCAQVWPHTPHGRMGRLLLRLPALRRLSHCLRLRLPLPAPGDTTRRDDAGKKRVVQPQDSRHPAPLETGIPAAPQQQTLLQGSTLGDRLHAAVLAYLTQVFLKLDDAATGNSFSEKTSDKDDESQLVEEAYDNGDQSEDETDESVCTEENEGHSDEEDEERTNIDDNSNFDKKRPGASYETKVGIANITRPIKAWKSLDQLCETHIKQEDVGWSLNKKMAEMTADHILSDGLFVDPTHNKFDVVPTSTSNGTRGVIAGSKKTGVADSNFVSSSAAIIEESEDREDDKRHKAGMGDDLACLLSDSEACGDMPQVTEVSPQVVATPSVVNTPLATVDDSAGGITSLSSSSSSVPSSHASLHSISTSSSSSSSSSCTSSSSSSLPTPPHHLASPGLLTPGDARSETPDCPSPLPSPPPSLLSPIHTTNVATTTVSSATGSTTNLQQQQQQHLLFSTSHLPTSYIG
ncbi:unnamed protein product [Protopolystoma xenopodis]|uniref:Uncharacterized protein n=1 Tax=Protopolystoma xenopodis TaxID=117903 RepID=A0A3S5AWS4_9PLAT|nr:unnamed protein product [Protopolystoma xenopodis]